MNTIRNSGRVIAGAGVLAWGFFALPSPGQTPQQTGDALEQSNLTWNATDWTVRVLLRGRADALLGTCPEDGDGPVLRTTITGPAKLVFDWTVEAASPGAVLGLSVDGHELELDTPHQVWRCIELQIPAGTHAVAWRPLPGATIYLDNVIYDAGQTMGFVLGLNDGDTGVWAVHTGSFGQAAATARDGLTSTAQLLPDENGQAVAYRLAAGSATEAVGLSYWQRQVGNGHGLSASPLLLVMEDYDEDFATWHFRERVASAGAWIKVAGNFLTGVPLPGALYLDDFKVEPLTLPWALDNPVLAWTSTSPDSVPWRVVEGSAPGAADGQAAASHNGPFETTLTATVQGPVLFGVSHIAISANGIGGSLLPVLNGTTLTPFDTATDSTDGGGTWRRHAIPIPAGLSTLSLQAGHTHDTGGSHILDACNLLTPAPALVAPALLSAGTALPVWSSQSGGVASDETVVRGAGATVCLTPERGKVSEVIIEVAGPAILSLWTKAEQGATLHACAGSYYAGDLSAYGGGDWEMRTIQVPDGPQHVHLLAGTRKIWLDDVMSIYTVPIAAALDFTSDIPDMAELPDAFLNGGFAAQLPPGSGAVGDDAVVFPANTTVWDSLNIPFNASPARIRFRHYTKGYLLLRQSGYELYYLSDGGPGQWREVDLIIPVVSLGSLVFSGSDTWVDHLRIDSIAPRPWAEASIPTTGVPAQWQAFDRADRLGGICAVSLNAGGSTDPLRLPLTNFGPCDITASWRRGRGDGPAFKFYCGAQSLRQSTMEWQPLHIHMDEPADSAFVVEYSWYETAKGGEGMVDDVVVTPREAMSFSKALDTDLPGANILSPGWTAVGTAIASVKKSESFDGEDALSIRPDLSVRGPQSVELRAKFDKVGFFHLRARRGVGGNAGCVLTWTPGSGPYGSRTLPVSPDWSLTSECVNGSNGTIIHIEVTVDGDDPNSAVYLDTFGWEPVPGIGALLEAPNFTGWTSAPAGAWTGACHPTPAGGSASAMEVTALPRGAEATLTGTVTGPGFVVFNTADRAAASEYTLEAAVGGTVVLSKTRVPLTYGPNVLVDQFFVPAGTHAVSWTVRAAAGGAIGPFRLLSVTLVPGTEMELLTERLPAAGGWRFSGDFLPQPLYNLSEGLVSPGGVSLPANGSWIERDVAGPAEVNVGYYSDANYDAAIPGRFSVNGQAAGQAHPDRYHPVVTRRGTTQGVSVPPGLHVFRWVRAWDDSSTIGLGPCVVGPPVISAEDAGPVIWINEGSSEFRWKSVTGRAFSGATALSARDTARGECLATGPGILSFMLAQDGRSIFGVRGGNQENYFYSSDPHDWQYVSLLIPPGQQRITFSESYCEPTDGTEIAWIDDMRFTPGGFAQWRATTLTGVEWGGNWESLDSDEDSVTDVFEYAFGTNAAKMTPETGPACSLVNGQLRLQFPTLPYTTTGLRYAVDESSNMMDWVQMAEVPASAPLAAGPALTLPPAPRRYVRTRVLVE